MSDYLIDSARMLSVEDAGGHGGRWEVFGDPTTLMKRWLMPMANEGKYVDLGLRVPLDFNRGGLPVAIGKLHIDDLSAVGRAGGMAVLEHVEPTATEEGKLLLASAYPFFVGGVEIESAVEEIAIHTTRLEARIRIHTNEGAEIDPFDTLFWKHGPHYKAGERYRFRVSGLAYSIRHVEHVVHVIDEPEQIRGYRAREAWAKKYGQWVRDRDEAAALAAWQPTSPEDLKPVQFSMAKLCTVMPAESGPADDHTYRGEVRKVHPRIFTLYGMPVWRVDVTLVRQDTDFTLPVYVAEKLFDSQWRPKPGEYVEGALWMQAYASERVEN